MELFLGLFFGTFVLEDVALASAILLVAENKISFTAAFFACFSGIAVGDVLLYGLGRFAVSHPRIQQWSLIKKARAFFAHPRSSRKMDFAVVISRAIPGTRLPTYTGAGLMAYPLPRFTVLTIVSVAVWVYGSFLAGSSLQKLFSDHPFIAFFAFFGFLYLVKKIAFYATDKWERRALPYKWRKWTHFEFWPAWFFYLPVIPFYIYHSLRTGSFLYPFSANPTLLNGGLVGESKWDFLKYLPENKPTTLASALLPKGRGVAEVLEKARSLGMDYPFILKPDVGQRGFAVRIIKNESDLTEYLRDADFDLILQAKSDYTKEAGLFYVRYPESPKGFLFSITAKDFPTVTGDGVSSIGELILKDPRARIMASVYFARHGDVLDNVLASGTPFALSECGNHCQGAIFLNGNSLITETLANAVDTVAKSLPHFYFGRIDVRYRSDADLKNGEHFQIIEINGSGSEATHIWDANTTLWEAYSTLFRQWHYLFDIGRSVRQHFPELNNVSVPSFFRDFFKQTTRDHSLSISS